MIILFRIPRLALLSHLHVFVRLPESGTSTSTHLETLRGFEFRYFLLTYLTK